MSEDIIERLEEADNDPFCTTEQSKLFWDCIEKINELESLLIEAREALEMVSECSSWGEHKYTCFEKGQKVKQALDRLKGEATSQTPSPQTS